MSKVIAELRVGNQRSGTRAVQGAIEKRDQERWQEFVEDTAAIWVASGPRLIRVLDCAVWKPMGLILGVVGRDEPGL